MVAVVERAELEELAERIMRASVRAQFLGLRGVVDALDLAFSDVVRIAEEKKVVGEADRIMAEALASEGGVGGS